MSTLLLPGAEPRGGDDQTPERTELLNAVGFAGAWPPAPGGEDVLAAVTPEGLVRGANLLAPEQAGGLFQARTAVLEQAEWVRAGLTSLPANLEAAHPHDPKLFAIEVLTYITTKKDPVETVA